jgi:hypothetical protein
MEVEKEEEEEGNDGDDDDDDSKRSTVSKKRKAGEEGRVLMLAGKKHRDHDRGHVSFTYGNCYSEAVVLPVVVYGCKTWSLELNGGTWLSGV